MTINAETADEDDFSLMMDRDDLLESLLPEFLRFILSGEIPPRLGGVLGTKISKIFSF